MADIVLTTFNAKYIHSAFGLRYLLANLGPLKDRAKLLEFDIKRKPADAANTILDQNPRIVGLSVNIWNVTAATELLRRLKRDGPEVKVVLGGPEVSFEIEQQEICRLADCVIAGEGDLVFADVCRGLLAGEEPAAKVIHAPPPDLSLLAPPYECYTDSDIATRTIYVEASRGCPFECEYCVSSHDVPVRYFALPPLLESFQKLLDRGATDFKFVDRSFNLNMDHAMAILNFFLARLRPEMFLHFEMVPDHFPERLREVIRRFPPGSVQLEIGIQTFNEDVAQRIKRRQNNSNIEANLHFLREKTGVQLHADLIAGLPGETVESFAAGFDRLVALRPHKIQVGILKRLRGTPIARHDEEWQMVYSREPPYEIVGNKLIDPDRMGQIKRFARFWELIANRENFLESGPLIWSPSDSAFQSFMRCSEWLYTRFRRDYGIPLIELTEALFMFLTAERKLDAAKTAESLLRDYKRSGRLDSPSFLRP